MVVFPALFPYTRYDTLVCHLCRFGWTLLSTRSFLKGSLGLSFLKSDVTNRTRLYSAQPPSYTPSVRLFFSSYTFHPHSVFLGYCPVLHSVVPVPMYVVTYLSFSTIFLSIPSRPCVKNTHFRCTVRLRDFRKQKVSYPQMFLLISLGRDFSFSPRSSRSFGDRSQENLLSHPQIRESLMIL